MKVLWIYAHPEPRSLTGSLRDEGLRALTELGHEYRESDLYAMRWNPVVDREDYALGPDERLLVPGESAAAYESGQLSPDIRAEQEKIEWADALVLQFPLWWYGLPAILKGWVDRVFVKGFGYGLTGDGGRVLRYGEGKLAGKRALAAITIGSRAMPFGPRGINGALPEALFPLLHGTFWYTGMSALPPFAVHSSDRAGAPEFEAAAKGLRARLETLATDDPISYRPQNGGDYDEDLVLKPHVEPGRTGLAVHTRG
ncbi:NAD(P)H-dependent oxidoreductase [Amycolatopsis alkalitolerans]|uniref:NAD(P)H-dependent oxidoreductase n=1 Tax=Amycolatopsis alkalitolerans TaxID=2547244 RepID=A0A5C4LXJ5_9PSEU|nr:NAD(P)H-dependent oxidoreductase [Amycolatopsis alkalitolerans]TNC22864.1 NAD(P)H-dependent oxidoreductase [Amycolatopsis alkalitolerans]